MRLFDPRPAGLLAGLLALAPAAAADAPSPAPPSPAPFLPPAPVPTAGGPVVVNGGGGCPGGDCGRAAGYAPGPIAAAHGGVASPVGCTDCLAEKTFLFGSSGQFFHPRYDGAAKGGKHGLFGHGLLHNPLADAHVFGRFRPVMVYGPGDLGGRHPCTYGSFGDR